MLVYKRLPALSILHDGIDLLRLPVYVQGLNSVARLALCLDIRKDTVPQFVQQALFVVWSSSFIAYLLYSARI